MNEGQSVEKDAENVGGVREQLDALHLRVLDVVTANLRSSTRRARRLTAGLFVVGILLVVTLTICVYLVVHLSTIDTRSAQVGLDFDNTIACFATGTNKAEQVPCELRNLIAMRRDEASLRRAGG